MILRLAPHLVGDYRSAPEVSFEQPFEPAHLAWITKDRSTIGHIGSPHLASSEKGEILFRVFSEKLVELLRRIAAA